MDLNFIGVWQSAWNFDADGKQLFKGLWIVKIVNWTSSSRRFWLSTYLQKFWGSVIKTYFWETLLSEERVSNYGFLTVHDILVGVRHLFNCPIIWWWPVAFHLKFRCIFLLRFFFSVFKLMFPSHNSMSQSQSVVMDSWSQMVSGLNRLLPKKEIRSRQW